MDELLVWLPIIIIFGIPAALLAVGLAYLLLNVALAIIIIPLELGLRIVGIDTRKWKWLKK